MKYVIVFVSFLFISDAIYSQVEVKASMFGKELNSFKGLPMQDTVIINFELTAADDRKISGSTARQYSGGIARWEIVGDQNLDLSRMMKNIRVGDMISFMVTTNYNDSIYLSYPVTKYNIDVINQEDIKKKERGNNEKVEYHNKEDN